VANEVLVRVRKASGSTQLEFGKAVANALRKRFPDKKQYSISDSYAQKKASLWESGQLIPTVEEFDAISDVTKLPTSDLKASFSVGAIASSAADQFRALAASSGQGLIASCFAGKVRQKLFPEDEEALTEALNDKVSMAIFFPFVLTSSAPARTEFVAELTAQHMAVWRTVVKFWRMLRNLAGESNRCKVMLYRPRIVGGANVLFPPMFHRSTLFCERERGRTKIDLFTWTQGEESDGLFGVGERSVERRDDHIEAWELFFGDIFEHWCEIGELKESDSYWEAYSEPSAEDNEHAI
jgi:hypothetical protein